MDVIDEIQALDPMVNIVSWKLAVKTLWKWSMFGETMTLIGCSLSSACCSNSVKEGGLDSNKEG